MVLVHPPNRFQGDTYRARSTADCAYQYSPNSPGDYSFNFLSTSQTPELGAFASPQEAACCSFAVSSPFNEAIMQLPEKQHPSAPQLDDRRATDCFLPVHKLALPRLSAPGVIAPAYTASRAPSPPVKVQILGGPNVGKTTLCRQFLTSEFMGEKTESFSEDNVERFITIEVDGWNRSLILIDNVREDAHTVSQSPLQIPPTVNTRLSTMATSSISPEFLETDFVTFQRQRTLSENLTAMQTPDWRARDSVQRRKPSQASNSLVVEDEMPIIDADVYIIVYSVDDENAFKIAKLLAQKLNVSNRDNNLRLLYLVGNKTDLVRKRQISTQRGKRFAEKNNCKFFEISTAINHLVDELLVDIVVQWKQETANTEFSRLGLAMPTKKPSLTSQIGRKSWVSTLSGPKNTLQRIFKQQFTTKSCINLQNNTAS
ncbi:unnamed protein product [Schistocephalus solidus]|uniref:GTP-binding protein RAD n=1 Tax=Schistocephalus solidus TaxID=70667 RepID=A0A183SQN6_SCHSO|nr:unnamed protein product [Schistocephalus solidus]